MDKKLKILAAADLHGDLGISEYLAEKAVKNKVDLVILAGDINGIRTDEKILAPFFSRKQKIVFVPGNWENYEDQKKFRNLGAKNIHHYYLTYGDVGLVGIGTGDWKFSMNEEDFDLLKANFSRMKMKKKILVSHVHAKGTKAEFSGIGGDRLLRKAVEYFEPDFLISAHIHEAEGLEDRIGSTRVFQVGRKGTILEI